MTTGIPNRHAATTACALLLACALASCALGEAGVQPTAVQAAEGQPCAAAASGPQQLAGNAAADWRLWQQKVQSLPLFAAAADRSSLSCSTSSPDDGAQTLLYRFGNGNVLRAVRDNRIELLDHTATFTAAPADPLQLLRATERALYGPSGCGIDWSAPETLAARKGTGATQGNTTIYRGDVCNCQAIVQRHSNGRVTALTLKSAC